MHWETLLKPVRFGDEALSKHQSDYTRTDFQRDYDRIIFSSPFRRLQNKTQVFPLPGNIFVHNRLTHSLEVASVGRSLGYHLIKTILKKEPQTEFYQIQEIPTIVSAACLAHDLGNPPFGHSGEESIRKYFTDNESLIKPNLNEVQWLDLVRFEGNANAFRLLTKQFEGKREGGFRISYPVLAAMIKYPYPSNYPGKKFGFFSSEVEVFEQISHTLELHCLDQNAPAFSRHPLAYLVEAADDICYQIMDIEDAYKLGILTFNLVKELYLNFFDQNENSLQLAKIDKTLHEVTDKNEQVSFLRALVIGKLIEQCSEVFGKNYEAIMEGYPVKSLIDQISGTSATAIKQIETISVREVYNHKSVVEIEIGGDKVISTLLHNFLTACLQTEKSQSKKILRLMPPQYNSSDKSEYGKILSVLDYISGMTDVYALELYRTFQGISIPLIQG